MTETGRDEGPDVAARRILRRSLKGSLATLARDGGGPYASLVAIATEPDGTPILLISRLALHTQNLLADPRASLLLDGTDGAGNPLAGGRVSIQGRVLPAVSETHRRRYLSRHPEAELYAGFADFDFYTFDIANAHFVGGFGRIIDLTRDELLVDHSAASDLVAGEADVIAHMNKDHADAVALYAAHSTGGAVEPGAWRMTGVDPEGFDLASAGRSARINFSNIARSPNEVRVELVKLVKRLRVGD
ncbi:MAG: DUF2470 domain-containing protein [Hyphomicrobium sp.]|nr:DUF2470 domain-containing protein [Hyphomicrobium sp.]